jgi:hypothetical protein
MAWVGTRGSISFENRTYRFSPSNPTSNSNSNTIFIAGSSSIYSLYNCTRVQYITLGSSPNRRFVIRYIGQLKYDSVNRPNVYDFSWEIVFYENDRTKFDACISSGLAIMANQKHLYTPEKKESKISINFARYRNDGSNSQLIR